MNKDLIDIGRSFTRLVNSFAINHRGFLLERSNGGFKLRDQYFENLEAVDQYIDGLYANLENKIDSFNRLKQNKNEQSKESNSEGSRTETPLQ